MPLRSDDNTTAPIVPPDSAPHILSPVNWVGNAGRNSWCWAACTVMISLFNEGKLPGTEEEVEALLCQVASQATGKKCCQSDDCDDLLHVPEINQLWENILKHPPDHQTPPFNQPPPIKDLIGKLKTELMDNRAIEVDISENARIGHVVVIYGFMDNGTSVYFYMRDPAMNGNHIPPQVTILDSELIPRCKNAWFGLK